MYLSIQLGKIGKAIIGGYSSTFKAVSVFFLVADWKRTARVPRDRKTKWA